MTEDLNQSRGPSESGSKEGRARSALLGAGATCILGVAVAGTVSRNVGGVLLVLGWLAFVYALHSFGRAGEGRG